MRLFRRSAYAVSHGNPPTPTELWARLEVASANIAHRCGGFRRADPHDHTYAASGSNFESCLGIF